MTIPWLSEDERTIKEIAERFGRERLKDGYQERENTPAIDRELLREMGALGLVAPNLAEEYGGIGASAVIPGLICEAISYCDFNMSYLTMTSPLLGGVLELHASEETKRQVLPKIAAGELIIALGLTEPRGGSDAANLIVKARKDGDRYIITGEKTSVSYSEQADMMTLWVRTDQDTAGAHGVSAFLVPLDLPGIERTGFNDLGTKPVGRGQVFFDEVEVPETCRIGEEGTGFTKIMVGFDLSRILIALQCVGAAQASVDETWQYVQERQAFGRPLAKFQGTTFPLAEHESKIAAVRALCYNTLMMRDKGMPHTKEAAMVKWMGPKWCTDIIQNCLLLHGHYGYTMDLPHQQRLRDVLGLQIGDGTAQVMKTVIARETIGNVGVAYK
jgi:cyclohexanecarboxyl-CoA dehydrogenase